VFLFVITTGCYEHVIITKNVIQYQNLQDLIVFEVKTRLILLKDTWEMQKAPAVLYGRET
jgi:hypothetical protein